MQYLTVTVDATAAGTETGKMSVKTSICPLPHFSSLITAELNQFEWKLFLANWNALLPMPASRGMLC